MQNHSDMIVLRMQLGNIPMQAGHT